MKRSILILICICLIDPIRGQNELEIRYDKIKEVVDNPESDYFYPKLLKRYNDFDNTLTLHDYSLIYYGFSFHEDYLKNQPKESILNDLLENEEYEKLIIECQKILDKNPVSLEANNTMGLALFKLNKPESEWAKYQNRFRSIRKVIVYSGDGLSPETAFKVIYISDEYNILYDYFEIPKIRSQSLVGLCDKFVVEPSDYYKAKEVYFDISQKLLRQQQLTDKK